MGQTKIEWTATQSPDGATLPGYSHNFWIGCTEVSPACQNCYARTMSERYGWAQWGDHPRHRTSEANWRKPLAWNAKAKKLGVRLKVFTNSLADFFDNQVDPQWRADAYSVIDQTPDLDWLILTKRPQNAGKMMIAARRALLGSDKINERHVTWPWPNVWLGTTVENQEEADRRIPHLLGAPAAVRFLSCEPLLGPIDLAPHVMMWPREDPTKHRSDWDMMPVNAGIDWVIVGNESGPRRRPGNLDDMRSLRDQCAAAGVAFFGKQDDKVHELPPDLQVRQMPARAG